VADPKGPAKGEYRLMRGGSWNNNASHLRSAFRYWDEPDYRADNLGFRVARDF
jgi:formylglycine-generating enzyme required for sulfatase activity